MHASRPSSQTPLLAPTLQPQRRVLSQLPLSPIDANAAPPPLPPPPVVTPKQVSKPPLPVVGTTASYYETSRVVRQEYGLSGEVALIARTHHSTVEKAFSNRYGRYVAVKIIDKCCIPAMLVDKFLPRELQISQIVVHPHIVRCLHIAQPHPTKVVIISEYYSGGTLLNYVIDRRTLAEKEGARLFRQLAEAIHYLHDILSVAHRDIKMENILIDSNTDIKLADFGFAKRTHPAEASTSFCGTRPYSAPQLVQQKPYNAFAADWYASGVVLYTMLTGNWPHERHSPAPAQMTFPDEVSTPARDLITSLMEPIEDRRSGYVDIVESEWLRSLTRDKWFLADGMFIYEVLPNPTITPPLDEVNEVQEIE